LEQTCLFGKKIILGEAQATKHNGPEAKISAGIGKHLNC